MSGEIARQSARALAKSYLANGDFTGWFEPFYRNAQGDPTAISWADLAPNPNLVEWLDREQVRGNGRSALVIGCGLGDDAEEVARRGFVVTAFDIAPTAVVWCKDRFPQSSVTYQVADLLEPPENWAFTFDFILEIYTIQCLPPESREKAFVEISRLLAPGGQLLVICRGRDASDPPGNLPWPLTREELAQFESLGLVPLEFEDFLDGETRRFRVLYRHV